jgi:hypothetical protein
VETLIAEDVLLLLLDERSGKVRDGEHLDVVLGGAVLAELALARAVTVPDRAWFFHRRVAETGDNCTDDEILQAAVELVGRQTMSAPDLVKALGKAHRAAIFARLLERGLVTAREERFLGVIRRTRFPAADRAQVHVLRMELESALLHGQQPTARTAAVIGVLSAIDALPRVIDRRGRSKNDIRRRAREIAAGDWAAESVRDAVRAAQAAIIAATTAAAAAGALAAGS